VPLETGRHVLALLSEEPAGRISTSNAGAISFRATLSWPPGEGMTVGSIFDVPTPGVRFYSLVQTDNLESATREISCEIRALHPAELTGALNAVLRSVTAHAALSEAVLTTRAVRLAQPSEVHPMLAEALAQQVSDSCRTPTGGGCGWIASLLQGNLSEAMRGGHLERDS
jgi:hypothetical protein